MSSSADRIGSLEWARDTSGVLTRGERATLAAEAIVVQLRAMPARLRHRLGIGRSQLAASLEDLRAPDSAACREAERLLDELRPSEVVGHSYRTFAWGRILGRGSAVEHDPEILYVACLVHDLGLAADRAAGPRCFTLAGAERAERLAGEAGWEPGRRHAVAEAITLHMNATVEPGQWPEAHLLTAGAQLDVTGMRYWELTHDAIELVLAQHPRKGSKRALAELFRAEAKANPGTRAALYDRLTRGRHPLRAPFAE
jgi:hypothetical protein